MDAYKLCSDGVFRHYVALTGRPERDTRINDDDVCNLKIALNMAKSVEEFIEMI